MVVRLGYTTDLIPISQIYLLDLLHLLLGLTVLPGDAILLFDSFVNNCPPFFKFLNSFDKIIVLEMRSSFWIHVLLSILGLLIYGTIVLFIQNTLEICEV